jgi:hypothetical protein
MTHRALRSPSSDGSQEQQWPVLEHQRRESSVGPFDLQHESPVIVQMNADRLRDKLSQIDTLPQKWMTQDELYYMAKAPDLWPWQRTDVLTPTPPDTPNSMPETSSLEASTQKDTWAQYHQNAELQTVFQQTTPLSKPLRPRRNLRSRQSNTMRTKGTKGAIHKKQTSARKHTMVTRSRCRGRCCRGIGFG